MALLPNLAHQSITQDFRENRFIGRDCRLQTRSSCSRSYGGKGSRSHRQALEQVLEWLWSCEMAKGSLQRPAGSLIPDPPPEGLQEALSAPVSAAYYSTHKSAAASSTT